MVVVASICQPSTLRMLIWPEASSAQNNMAAVSAEGSTVCVFHPAASRGTHREGHGMDLSVLFKAASELAVSQPAISRAIADMEHALGVPLLDRSLAGGP